MTNVVSDSAGRSSPLTSRDWMVPVGAAVGLVLFLVVCGA
jgi:hypothetical protein